MKCDMMFSHACWITSGTSWGTLKITFPVIDLTQILNKIKCLKSTVNVKRNMEGMITSSTVVSYTTFSKMGELSFASNTTTITGKYDCKTKQ